MVQLWLVLLGAVLMWRADRVRYHGAADALFLLGAGCLVISVILFFINGGTTG